MFDVIIIGAGVIGAMMARELSRYRLQTVLLEKENDVAMGASCANSGIIHGGHDPIPGTLKAKLNAVGNPLLYEAARELNVPCRNNGALVCAFGRPEEEASLHMLLERGIANGVHGLSLLSREQVRDFEPGLSGSVSEALYIPTSGIICPYDLTLAAVGNAMDNGVQLRCNFEVTAIDKRNGFSVSSSAGDTVRGRYLINCAGGWSGQIAHLLGDESITVIPRAGEYMLLDQEEGSRIRHTIFQVPGKEGKGILVTPTVDGNLLTGPTAVKVETADCTQTTAEGLGKVRALASKSVPGIRFSQVITSFAGVRASAPGGDFIIRPSESAGHALHMAAIDSPGLTCCVSAARYAVEQLRRMGMKLTEKGEWNGTRANPRAFREMTEVQQDAFIKKHPDYGKIVCRCETVSEGEIRDAIRRNPPASDLDGIKRRTRSGMGRCQGGFCSPRVLQILAEECGKDITRITKNGQGSEVLTGRL